MNTIEKSLDILKQEIQNIYPINMDCWNELKTILSFKTIKKEDYFSKEGEKVRGLGFIQKGILRIYYLDDEGNEWNKHFLLENDFVAASVSLHKNSITNIQALSETEIIFFPIDSLMKLANKYKDILIFIQKLTFLYLEQKQAREIDLLSKDAKDKYLAFKDKFPYLENKIQHFHIASYLGITPTQLSRIRKNIAHQQM